MELDEIVDRIIEESGKLLVTVRPELRYKIGTEIETIIDEDEDIKKVLFFTAYVTWDSEKRERHKYNGPRNSDRYIRQE